MVRGFLPYPVARRRKYLGSRQSGGYSLRKIVAENDLVFIHCTTTGTHTGGEWLGIAPAGNRLEFDVVDMFRLEDGKLAEHWDVADTYTLFSQRGKIK